MASLTGFSIIEYRFYINLPLETLRRDAEHLSYVRKTTCERTDKRTSECACSRARGIIISHRRCWYTFHANDVSGAAVAHRSAMRADVLLLLLLTCASLPYSLGSRPVTKLQRLLNFVPPFVLWFYNVSPGNLGVPKCEPTCDARSRAACH